MARRFFFSAPDLNVAIGGVFVIYDVVRTLRSAGYEAYVLHNSPNFAHAELGDEAVRHSFALRRAFLALCGWRWRLVYTLKILRDQIFGGREGRVELGPDDVLVLPEVDLNLVPHLGVKARLAVPTQNPFTQIRILGRTATQEKIAAAPTIATSEACKDMARRLGAADCRLVPLAVDEARFAYQAEKKARIVYMPRKNAADAKTVIDMLRRRGKVDDFEITPIEGVTRDEVAAHLGDATGYPVREGDLMGFGETVEQVVADYRADPHRLDHFRKAASETILSRYSAKKMRAALLDAWEGFFGAPEGRKAAA